MSTHQADPIATLRANQGSVPWTLTQEAALAELERRAKIEARRDASSKRTTHIHWDSVTARLKQFPTGHCHEVFTLLRDGRKGTGTGPTYHTALEAALNAAGTPCK